MGLNYEYLMSVRDAKFKIVGMYCTTCKPIVEKQLRGEPAIKSIEIDFMTDSVVVRYDSDAITKEEIRARLQKSGYQFSRSAM
jgi:copper chaperone